MVSTIDESTRQLVAERIKTGGTLDAEIGRAGSAPGLVQRDKDSSR